MNTQPPMIANQIYPLVVAQGNPADRGRMYGGQARSRIHKSIENYMMLFEAYADLDWVTVKRYAMRYEPIIRRFDAELVEEMDGIARAARVDFADILALNVRTEIMYGLGEVHAAECTAFVAQSSTTRSGHTLLGQNWDWNHTALDSCIVLALGQVDRPSILTVVEAGLLAKMGMNSDGLGVATNAMATDLDQGAPDVPYHVLLRSMLNCTTVPGAVELLKSTKRASSGNFLVASSRDEALDIETAPGGPEHVFAIEPKDGVIGHANCFIADGVTVRDVTAVKRPKGRQRQEVMDSYLEENRGALTIEGFMRELTNHENAPNCLCRHPLAHLHPADRSATVASVVMDLTTERFWVADGPPCSNTFREIDVPAAWSWE